MIGKVHSIQSLGTVDGPGVRFVLFMQGCNLRCACCHNPDTWNVCGGTEYTPEQILKKVTRYREYFGKTGGITLSGGEPLLQADFAAELFSLCKSEGINTCLDTSGSLFSDSVERLLSVTDRVLLDIKFTCEDEYVKYTGGSLEKNLSFLSYLEKNKIKTTVRQVIIPTLNDTEENIKELCRIINQTTVVDKVELLPFRKICSVKYESMNIPFPLANIPEPTKEKMAALEAILKKHSPF